MTDEDQFRPKASVIALIWLVANIVKAERRRKTTKPHVKKLIAFVLYEYEWIARWLESEEGKSSGQQFLSE